MTLDEINQLAKSSRDIKTVNDEYADKRCGWCVDLANKGQNMWWGKDQPYYRFLYLVAKNFAGGMAIEVGTFHGIGFSCLAAGATASKNQKSWTVGIDKDNHQAAIEVTTKYNNCQFVNGLSTSQSTIKIIDDICKKENIKINIMFIDATHTLSWVNEELKTYKHLFADQVILIFDDIIKADNNTNLPECFDALPGQKVKFPNLHTDNCIAVALSSKIEFEHWNPPPPVKLGY
jgi:hypothetical protein